MADLTLTEQQNIAYFNKLIIADAYIKELHKEIKFLKEIIYDMNLDLTKVKSDLVKETKESNENLSLRNRVATLSSKKDELRRENWELKKLLKQLNKESNG